MAFERLIMPAPYRNTATRSCQTSCVRGFEEFRFLQDVAGQDLFAHLAWNERLAPLTASQAPVAPVNAHTHTFVESEGELSVTHTHDVSEFFHVKTGEITVIASPFVSIHLRGGESIVIPRRHLHGSIVTSDECRYSLTALN